MPVIKSHAEYGSLTVEESIREFVLDRRITNRRPATLAFYERRLSEFLSPWLQKPLVELSLGDIRARSTYCLDEKGLRPTTINGYLRATKALLNWALDENYDIQADPRAIRKLTEPKRVMPHLSTQEEIEALLRQPDRRSFFGMRDYTMILLTLDTGVRVSELIGLDADDVHLPFIKVRGKGDKERMLQLSDNMLRAMTKYLRLRANCGADGPALFPSRHGGRVAPRTFAGHLKRYGEAAGITGMSLSPHKLRYTHASWFLRNGGGIVNLQLVLGHSSLAMTRHYAQMTDADAFEDSRRYSPVSKLKL